MVGVETEDGLYEAVPEVFSNDAPEASETSKTAWRARLGHYKYDTMM